MAFEAMIGLRVVDGTTVVKQAVFEIAPLVFLDGLARVFLDPFAAHLPKILIGPRLSADPDHSKIVRQQPVKKEVVNRWKQFPTGQIPRTAENHKRTGRKGRSFGRLI